METRVIQLIDTHAIAEQRIASGFDPEQGTIMLRLSAEYLLPCGNATDESFYIRALDGEIVGDPEDGRELIILGTVSIQHALASQVWDFPFYADTHSGDMARMASDLFTGLGLARGINDAYGLICNRDFIAIEQIRVLPQFRDRGIGSMVIAAVIEIFKSACGFVALTPYPIECEEVNSGEEVLNKAEKEAAITKASKRLQKFYERLGFRLLTEATMTYCTELERQPSLAKCNRIRRANRGSLAQSAPEN